MSELLTTKITDRAGTGSPNFSQGLKISGTDSGLLAPTRTEGETQPDAETSSNGDTFYDTVNETYDILTEGAWVRVLGSGGGSGWTADLSQVTYDSVSLGVTSQENNPQDIEFSPDGTKMYVTGFSSDLLHQYSLSTAFDLSTASYDSVSLDAKPQGPNPRGLAFNNDGTKLYHVGNSNDVVLQYSLSTAYDLSTASYDSVSFNITNQDGTPGDLEFNTDGTKMYMLGVSSNAVHQYNLSTGFDLSTASYSSVSFSFAAVDTASIGIHFNPDGTKMYMAGAVNDKVFRYTLSTAFDISTASYDNDSFSIASQEQSPTGLTFSSDGTKMYIVGTTGDKIWQYSTGL
jgi:sugar lactone lactonase YvrE